MAQVDERIANAVPYGNEINTMGNTNTGVYMKNVNR